MLRREELRLTSLFGGSGDDEEVVVSGNMGVVDPECENATEPFECETAAEPGRDMGVWAESRDADMLLDRRRSQEVGCDVGVPVRDTPPPMVLSSPSALRSGGTRKLALGVRVRFCPIFALPERVFSPSPSLIERAEGGVVAETLSGMLRE